MLRKALSAIALVAIGTLSMSGVATAADRNEQAMFTATDYLTPTTLWLYDGANGSLEKIKASPARFDSSRHVVEQLEAVSRDGTRIPYFLIRPRDMKMDGSTPTLLYGYGGFGISMTPGYSGSVLAWVEAGGVYAVACLRGGGEEGERWHRDGMLANKQRVFDDLHAAAEYLVEERWTTSPQLGISGGSNGGLLVGAALTQRPDLYRSVVCSAPLLDMVRYERQGLGHFWAGEYGTVDDPSELKTLLTYSPYHRVRDGTAYPATLFTVFGSDTRVDPLHARKMCAALQHATSADPGMSPVLIRVESDVGHGARSVSRSIALAADVLGFQAWATGLADS